MSFWADEMKRGEVNQGYTLIKEAPWLNRLEWKEIVISEDEKGRIRFVLLDALIPHHGAFTRLLAGVLAAGLTPVIVEPIGEMKDWCVRHKWKKRMIRRRSVWRHEIWYPR